ncbi:MAG: 50S ribosomal protein L24 [Nitrososphaeraceae archaeon]|nr:50S ribosomal protein L24 [Nitrososphaeraceae archaeon]
MSSSNATILSIPKHILDARICSSLTDDLRKQYGRRSARVVKGDTVKVMRGEYAGIEGKVEKVNTERGTLAIEGVQREKIRGGNVKVQIHASEVTILSFNLQDTYRRTKLQSNLDGRPKGEQQYTANKRARNASKNEKTERKLAESDK